MSISGFNAIPIRGYDFDEDVGIQRQFCQAHRAMEGRGLQLGVWILDANLERSLELACPPLKRTYRRFDGFIRRRFFSGLLCRHRCLFFFSAFLGLHRFGPLAISLKRLQLVLDFCELGGFYGDI